MLVRVTHAAIQIVYHGIHSCVTQLHSSVSSEQRKQHSYDFVTCIVVYSGIMGF